ncbi:hypothetical protein, partial [Dysgonomonas sp. GY617]
SNPHTISEYKRIVMTTITHYGYENIPANHPHVERFHEDACTVCFDTNCITSDTEKESEIRQCWSCGSEFLADGEILLIGTKL